MSRSLRSAIALAVTTLWLGSAGAIEVALPGDLSSWVCTGQCGASGNDGDIVASPFGSPRYAFASGGDYRIEVGVVNWGDGAFDSGLAFDVAGLSAPVPEPATATLMLAALGVIAMRVGRRRAGH
jgi:hypothetical protein